MSSAWRLHSKLRYCPCADDTLLLENVLHELCMNQDLHHPCAQLVASQEPSLRADWQFACSLLISGGAQRSKKMNATRRMMNFLSHYRFYKLCSADASQTLCHLNLQAVYCCLDYPRLHSCLDVHELHSVCSQARSS